MLAVMPQAALPLPTPADAHTVRPIGTDDSTTQLRSMFPDVDLAIITDILVNHQGNMEAAVLSLLEMSDTEAVTEERDRDVARTLQLEQDEVMAKALAATLQEELNAEAAAQTQEKQARRSTMGLSAAQKFLKRVRERPTSTRADSHAMPLLDEPLDGPSNVYDMTPLDAQQYTPPSATDTAVLDVVTTEAPISDDNGQRMTSTRPSQYSSRLDRARSANRQRTQSRLSSQAVPEQASASPLLENVTPLQASNASAPPLAPPRLDGDLI